MPRKNKVITTIPCSDLDACVVFYKDVLGLTESEVSIPQGVALESGPDDHIVYLYSTESSVGDATRFTFLPDDFDGELAEIRAHKVELLDVTIPEMESTDGVLTDPGSGMRACWFKDPGGNVIALTEIPKEAELRKTA